MNKKIISAAIAATFAVSGVAVADAMVTGHLEQAFFTDGKSAGDTDINGGDDMFVVISASEDLGNGMSAFGKVRLEMDADSANGNATAGHTDSIVGLKGDFGTIMAGRAEAFVESKLMATMSFDGHTVIEDSLTGTPNTGRHDNMIAYVSPSFNGLTVGIGAYTVNANTAEDFDATELYVAYSNGPLTLQAGYQNLEDSLVATLAGLATPVVVAENTLALSASYTMDALKATVLYTDEENGTNESQDVALRLDYTMGNNVIRGGYLWDEDFGTNGADGDDTLSLELVHNFSKRTSAYIGTVNPDNANDYQYIGLQHNF